METLLTNLSEGILTITINRPDKLNALNAKVLSELDTIMQEVYKEQTIYGVILTGSGNKA
ncbi:MAG: enoyl-CoA hydratase/isomerase family protein, partial [Sphingobacteriales bacterium]